MEGDGKLALELLMQMNRKMLSELYMTCYLDEKEILKKAS